MNLRRQQGGGECRREDNYGTRVPASPDSGDEGFPVILRYFKSKTDYKPGLSNHLNNRASGGPRFFRNDGKDMTDVREVWQTGWNRCQTTGSLGPNPDARMVVSCDKL